jgi:hypothetical protein
MQVYLRLGKHRSAASLYIVMAHAGLATALLVLYGLYLLALPHATLRSSTATLVDIRAALLRRPLMDSLVFPRLLRWLVSFFFFLVLFKRLNASGGRLP